MIEFFWYPRPIIKTFESFSTSGNLASVEKVFKWRFDAEFSIVLNGELLQYMFIKSTEFWPDVQRAEKNVNIKSKNFTSEIYRNLACSFS